MRRAPTQKCLILAGNNGIGNQIAFLLQQCRWQTNIVHSDQHAYDCLESDKFDTVIADIDAADLGGLAVLAFCHQQYPAIATYAIARSDDEYGKKMASEAGGCRGFVHLYDKKAAAD